MRKSGFRHLILTAALVAHLLWPALSGASASSGLLLLLEGAVGREVLLTPRALRFSRWTIEGIESRIGRSADLGEDLPTFLRRLDPSELEAIESIPEARRFRGELENIERRLRSAGLLQQATLSRRARSLIRVWVEESIPARRQFFNPVPSSLENARAELNAVSAAGSMPAREFSVEAGKAQLVGVRLPNPGGQPVVLAHGVMESSHIWQEISKELQSLGYDIWMPNWRGHGRSAMRSGVLPYKQGDYGFTAMLEQDVPALLEHVFSATGKRPFVVGHSMGGMLSRGAPESLVRARVEIGAPFEFGRVPFLSKVLAKISAPVPRLNVTTPVPDFPWGPEKNLARWLQGVFRSVRNQSISWAIPDGLVRLDNLSPGEFAELVERVVSPLHADIMHDFGRFIRAGRGPEAIDLGRMAASGNRTPLLVIAGERDCMAPASSVFQHARSLPRDYPVWTALIEGAGHVDLVLGKKAAERVVPLLHRFFQGPETLGVPGAHQLIRSIQ